MLSENTKSCIDTRKPRPAVGTVLLMAVLGIISLLTTMPAPTLAEEGAIDPAMIGRWRQRGMFVNGQLLGVNIEGKRMVVHAVTGSQMATGTFELEIVSCDPTAEPMQMDAKLVRAPEGNPAVEMIGRTILFVYEINGSQLQMMGWEPEREGRPQSVSEEGDGIRLRGSRYGSSENKEHSVGADGVDMALQGRWAALDDPAEFQVTDDNHTIVEDAEGNVILVAEMSNQRKVGTLNQFDMTYIQHPDANMVDQRMHCASAMDEQGRMRVAIYTPRGEPDANRYPASVTPVRGVLVIECEKVP